MSHKERKEKDCLNCGTTVLDRYCHVCGQENLETKETFWSMFVHFFNDITHFDGKFFNTAKLLFTQPGRLSTDYIAGKRASYLNPIRLYVFTSGFFFFVFFFFFSSDINIGKKNQGTTNAPIESSTSAGTNAAVQGETTPVIEYDKQQASLSPEKRDGWLTSSIKRNALAGEHLIHAQRYDVLRIIIDKFLHSIPYLLFLSLPIYAFYLSLLHYRKRQTILYADHAMLLIHLYVFTFLWFLSIMLLSSLGDQLPSGFSFVTGVLRFALFIYGVYYAFMCMLNFYGQSKSKTLIKFCIFNMLCFGTLTILFAVSVLISFSLVA